MGKALNPAGSASKDTIPPDTMPKDTIPKDTIPIDTIAPPKDTLGLAGDWLLVEVILNTPDSEATDVSPRKNEHTFVTVKPSRELIKTYLDKFGDFWIEGAALSGNWGASGDTLSMSWAGDSGAASKWAYRIGGDTLTCTQINGDNGGTERQTYISGNLAKFKDSVTVYNREPALAGDWVLEVDDTIGLYLGMDGSFGGSDFSNYDNRYIDVSEYEVGATWYADGDADGGKLFVFGLECGDYGEDGHSCVSYSIAKKVELEYMTGEGGFLLLGFPGSNMDVWAPLPSGGGKVK
jgi:hypothetical protein